MTPEPFAHAVMHPRDPYWTAAAARDWPGEWPYWLCYNSPLEQKRTCNDWAVMPPAVRRLLADLLLLPVPSWLGLGGAVPSDLLHGGGMHDMRRGGFLSCHLDHDRHALTGLERSCTAVLFVGDRWQDGWGGELELWPADRREPAVRITPRPGRLVAFANTDLACHSVAPLTCPEGVARKTLTCFWYTLPVGEGKRSRARFVASGAELLNPDPALEALREARAG